MVGRDVIDSDLQNSFSPKPSSDYCMSLILERIVANCVSSVVASSGGERRISSHRML